MLTTLASAAIAYPGYPMGGIGFGFGWLFLLIPFFWIGLFVLIFVLVGRRWRRNGGPRGYWGPGYGGQGGHYGHGWGGSSTRDAERTLAERFAQGDIDETEYRARLEVLRANQNRPEGPSA